MSPDFTQSLHDHNTEITREPENLFNGWIIEFLLGAWTDILWSATWVTIMMTPWTILTYAAVVIVPVTILFEAEKFKNKKISTRRKNKQK